MQQISKQLVLRNYEYEYSNPSIWEKRMYTSFYDCDLTNGWKNSKLFIGLLSDINKHSLGIERGKPCQIRIMQI